MINLFKFTGWATIIISVFATFALAEHGLWPVVTMFFGIVNGLALIALGGVLEYTSYLKKKLNIHMPSVDKKLGTSTVKQVTCFKCGDRHDFDYPKCPSCGS